MSADEKLQVLRQEKLQNLEDQKKKLAEDIKMRYMKIDKEHNQILYKNDEGLIKHFSLYRPQTTVGKGKNRFTHFASIESPEFQSNAVFNERFH